MWRHSLTSYVVEVSQSLHQNYAIADIAHGPFAHKQAVIDTGIIPMLIEDLQNANPEIREEACRAVLNVTNGESPQIRYLVSQGCIEPLCGLLRRRHDRTIWNALTSLGNILKVGETDKQAVGPGAVNDYALYVRRAEGAVGMRDLQQHNNSRVRARASNILNKYFRRYTRRSSSQRFGGGHQ